MLDLTNVKAPIEMANGLPNDCHVSANLHQHEQNTLLRDNWTAIGFGKDLPKPGGVKPIEFVGLPLLLVRYQDNEIKVFKNVCRHRGMILVSEAQQLRGLITCPFHAWAYDLNGQLLKTPHIGGPDVHHHDTVNHCDYRLNEVRSYQWRDIIFVNIGGQAASFETYACDLIERWQEPDQPVYHSGRDLSFNLTVNRNWKLAVKNCCEAYHLPYIHPGLNSYSRLKDHYNIMPVPAYAGQGSTVYEPQVSNDGHAFPNFEGLSKQWSSGAEYVALFPNLLLGVHRDHGYGIISVLNGPNRTIEHFEIYYAQNAATKHFLPICVPPILKCGAIFLSKMYLFLKACRKAVIPANVMVANSRL
jgi:choline monooxygenase